MIPKRTLNDFFIEGNKLISNNYSSFDDEVLEIRIQALYGERPLRPFSNTRLQIMAQNVIDMYSGYLKELFEFSSNYNILTPEVKEIVRKLSYKKTNDDTRDISGNDSGSTHSTSTGSGTDSTETSGSGTDHSKTDITQNGNQVTDGTQTTTYGKKENRITNNTMSENGTDNADDTTTHTGTATTAATGTNGDTVTKSISAYNQTTSYSPREQDVTNGTSSSNSTLTNDLTDHLIHGGSYEKSGTNGGTDDLTYSGSDTTKTDSTTTTTDTDSSTTDGSSSSTSKTNGTHDSTTTTDGTSSSTRSSKDTFTGSESYDLNEQTKETGRLNYEEILNTIENLFNPYDWLATKIVNTICEVFYEKRYKKI